MFDFVHTNEDGADVWPRRIYEQLRPQLRELARGARREHPRDQRLLPRLRCRPRARRRARGRRPGGALHAARSTTTRFPINAIALLPASRRTSDADGIDAVVYYDKPLTTFVRLLQDLPARRPRGLPLLPPGHARVDAAEALDPVRDRARPRALGYRMPKDLWFTEHHESHAASAFFPSPFESAAILTFDGVGEWATSSIGVGRGQPHRRSSASSTSRTRSGCSTPPSPTSAASG